MIRSFINLLLITIIYFLITLINNSPIFSPSLPLPLPTLIIFVLLQGIIRRLFSIHTYIQYVYAEYKDPYMVRIINENFKKILSYFQIKTLPRHFANFIIFIFAFELVIYGERGEGGGGLRPMNEIS